MGRKKASATSAVALLLRAAYSAFFSAGSSSSFSAFRFSPEISCYHTIRIKLLTSLFKSVYPWSRIMEIAKRSEALKRHPKPINSLDELSFALSFFSLSKFADDFYSYSFEWDTYRLFLHFQPFLRTFSPLSKLLLIFLLPSEHPRPFLLLCLLSFHQQPVQQQSQQQAWPLLLWRALWLLRPQLREPLRPCRFLKSGFILNCGRVLNGPFCCSFSSSTVSVVGTVLASSTADIFTSC